MSDIVSPHSEHALPHPRPVTLLPWHPGLLPLRDNRFEGPPLSTLLLRAMTVFDHGASANRIIVGRGFRNRGLAISVVGQRNLLRIGQGVALGGRITIYGDDLVVEIGDRCDAKQVRIVARHAGVRIGADCLLARGIAIRSSDIHTIRDRATGAVVNSPAAVEIGDQVWIAHGVFIGKGVRVPRGCVLGAGAVLTRSIELPHCVIAGHPARVVREGIAWER